MEIGALPTEGPGVFRTLLLPDTARALEEREELESYTPQRLEEMDRRFEEGMVELREIFRGQARRMVEKYGRLISQLHPEDFCARLGKDFFDDTMFLQDLGLMLDNAPQYFDFEHNEEDRKLRIFYDYFHNAVVLHGIYFINVRSFQQERVSARRLFREFGQAMSVNQMFIDEMMQNEDLAEGEGFTPAEQEAYQKSLEQRFQGNEAYKLNWGRFAPKAG